MKNLFAALSDEARGKLRRREQPSWFKPMLATLTHDPFSDKAWFYYDHNDLVYAGMVGTGFDDGLLEHLKRRLARLERKTPAFARKDKLPGKHVHWVSPRLVAQVAFTEWTDGKLRHPRFLGLRRDKNARSVTRETPKA